MRVAMIGGVGHQWYVVSGVSATPGCVLAAVAKGAPNEDVSGLLSMISDTLGEVPKVYDDWRAMLDAERPDIVGVAPVFHLHQPISLECLRRGIHVMCEKPVATTLEGLNELERAWRMSNAEFVGMHAMRYQPNFRALKTALDSGAIGRPVLSNSQKSYYFTTNRPKFYKRRELYGGTLCWVASHALDWNRWFMGPIKFLNAYHTTIGNKGYGECESSGVISFAFENGCIGCVNFDFLKAAKDEKPRDACRIAGELGVLEALEGKAYVTTHDVERRALPLPKEENFFKEFVEKITSGKECLLDAEQTFEVTRYCLLARDSADAHGIRSPMLSIG